MTDLPSPRPSLLTEFPRSGLIEQLRYDGYSADQAAHGATAAGL
ncbi:hypothetical protein [Dietzia sp. CH92]|nr:hypothetical protein [Dietzia sp. CH92]